MSDFNRVQFAGAAMSFLLWRATGRSIQLRHPSNLYFFDDPGATDFLRTKNAGTDHRGYPPRGDAKPARCFVRPNNAHVIDIGISIPARAQNRLTDLLYRRYSYGMSINMPFQDWLKRLPGDDLQIPLPALRQKYGEAISPAAAYRAAISLGVRGSRRNRSRYDAFWAQLDWRLPTRVLATIWQIDRANLRARRLRLGIDPPRWSTAYEVRLPGFANAVAAEQKKAAAFVGPRPDRAVRRRAVAVLEVA